MEKLTTQSTVIGSNGMPAPVVRVWHRSDRPRYQVTTDDGHSIIVDEAQQWLVLLDRRKKAWTVRETNWLANRASCRKPRISMAAVVGEQLPLPLDPYTLGAWLGDGTRTSGQITKPMTDQATMRPLIEAAGFVTTDRSGLRSFGVLKLYERVRDLGIAPDKHIPDLYFNASIAQRMELLRGLIDTDGYVDPRGSVEFCSIDERLARGVARLVNSLGVKASVSIGRATLNGVDHGPKYRVIFYMKGCAHLPRKNRLTRDGVRTVGRYLSFKRISNGDTTCIEVATPDGLYLSGDAQILMHDHSNKRLPSRQTTP